MAKILIVEDNPDLSVTLEESLKADHHTVEVVGSGDEGIYRLRHLSYDLAVLDIQLPGMSGIEVCRQFRDGGGKIPVLMLTGLGDITNKESGFDAGADDYLTKPFMVRELIARVRALLRRAPEWKGDVLRGADIVLDPVKFEVTKKGVPVNLMPIDFALLEFLMRHSDKTISQEKIIDSVWHTDKDTTPGALRTAIRRLRQKLDDFDDPDQSVIRTIPRIGYKFCSSK